MNYAPKKRFPEFTASWEQRKLGDICKRVQGNDGNMDLPTLTISAGEGWLDQRDRFNRNIAGKEQKNYTLLKTKQLSYNHGNSKLAKYGVVFALKDYEKALVPRVYHSFDVSDFADPDFVEYMFATKIPDKELSKLVSSGARMDGLLNINYDAFMGINITIPSLEEQVRISGHLRSLDTLITLHQHKLDMIKEYKKGCLQRMFPRNEALVPEIRFPEFTTPWGQHKLADIANIIDPHPSHRAPAAVNEGIPFIGIGDVDVLGNINKESARTVDESIYDEHHRRYDLDIPSLGIGRVASLGKVIRLRNDIGKYAVSPTMSIIQFQDTVDIDYMYSCMESPIFQKQFASQSNGSTRQSVGIQDLRELLVSIPENEKEQRQIGSYFKVIDNLITLHQCQLDKYKELKKGLLQQMFI